MILHKNLQALGLNKKEAGVYLAVLELGEASIGALVKKSGIKRTTAYDIIGSLREKGLLTLTKNKKRTRYLAEDPRVLEHRLEEQKRTFRDMLPELLAITNSIDRKPRIRYYEGLDGIKEVYKDVLRHPDMELLAWVPEEAVEKFDEQFLNEYYIPRRTEKKIWQRVIAPDMPSMRKYRDLDQQSLRRTRLIPAEKFPLDVEISLYGERKIAVMSFEEGMGMIIESKKLFTTLKSIFEMNWEACK